MTKKFFIVFMLILSTLAPALAFQYIEESGRRIYANSPDEVYEAFTESLTTSEFRVKKVNKNAHSTTFRAADVDFFGKVFAIDEDESVLQMSPVWHGRVVPQGVYRKVFQNMDGKLSPTL